MSGMERCTWGQGCIASFLDGCIIELVSNSMAVTPHELQNSHKYPSPIPVPGISDLSVHEIQFFDHRRYISL
jgi:hypothetical protein